MEPKFIRQSLSANKKIERVQRITIRNRERIIAVAPEAQEFIGRPIDPLHSLVKAYVDTRGEFKYIVFAFGKFVTKCNGKYYVETPGGVTEVTEELARECIADDELIEAEYIRKYNAPTSSDIDSGNGPSDFGFNEGTDDFEGFDGIEEEFEDHIDTPDFGIEPTND